MATSAERLKQYEDLYAQRQQAQDVPAYQNQFEKDYLEATDYNKDLIQQKSSALGRLQAVAPEMRERYMTGPVMSPTQQRNLIAQARQNPISEWGSAIDLLTQRGMKLQDILGESVAGYQSQLAAQDRDLENAWRLYQDMIQQEQFNRSLRNSGGGGGGGISISMPGAGNQQDDLDITVDDRNLYQKTLNATDNAFANSPFLGSDLSDWQNMNTGEKVLSSLNLLNPLTLPKTVGGFVGNYLGNKRQDNMSFVDKLFNRKPRSSW